MFFMHRGYGSMGGSGGGHAHGLHDHNSPDVQRNNHSGPNFAAMEEAEYEEVKEEVEKEIN